MILTTSITNFLSFKQKTTFNMIANSSKILKDNYIIKNDKKILKTATIYGVNASGKSNFFKIIYMVVFMLRNSNNTNINDKLPIIPFKFDKHTITQPSEFEIQFISNNNRYIYGFKADSNNIYQEYLYQYNNRKVKIFCRDNINKYSYNKKYEKFLKGIENKNSHNKFFLSTATNWNFKPTKEAYQFITNGINVCFNMDEVKNLAFNIYAEGDKQLKEFTLQFLNKTNFNIEDYNVTKIDVPKDIFTNMPEAIKNTMSEKIKGFQVLFKHKGASEYLNFNVESLGTQMIFLFIPFIYETLGRQKTLIIDELNRSLHPFLTHYIVDTFNDSDINKNGSQLIFNTNDTYLLSLNILRSDQIWFTEKNNDNGESYLYSLNEFPIKKYDNIELSYRLRKYSAVPFIQNTLNLI